LEHAVVASITGCSGCRDLGAVEAMSITSLVGLSVDFCIHMSEAFNHAQSTWRPDDAPEHAQEYGFFKRAVSKVARALFSSTPPGREKAKYVLSSSSPSTCEL
jgi:hypothetical protein